MSTILDALQKSKLAQAGGIANIAQQHSQTNYWKIAISCGLLIIILLLSTLIYLQLTPRSEVPSNTAPLSAQTQLASENHLIKVNFETKPLPTPTPEIKRVPPVKKVAPVKLVKKPEQVVKSQPQINQKKDNKIAIEDVPSDLKKRFELALLMTDIEQNESPNEAFSESKSTTDGSDIHEMSSDFQDKVPLIRYDSHMYSSVANDRWIRINGEKLKEGEFDSSGEIELLEIQPQRSIFRLQRQSFSIESLTDWKGY